MPHACPNPISKLIILIEIIQATQDDLPWLKFMQESPYHNTYEKVLTKQD